MQYTHTHQSIKTWAEDDRPREKLLLKGFRALSDAEIIAILLNTGTRDASALELAKQLLQSFDNNLHELGQAALVDLQKIKGIGQAKAIAIAAALELGRRRQSVAPKQRPQILSSKDAYQILGPLLMDLAHEEFWILVLNRANFVLQKIHISSGSLTGTVVDIKKIFRSAFASERANSVILCHNHPSGNPQPSQADIDLTRKVREAGKFLEMTVFDHIIVAGTKYYSFADEGLLI